MGLLSGVSSYAAWDLDFLGYFSASLFFLEADDFWVESALPSLSSWSADELPFVSASEFLSAFPASFSLIFLFCGAFDSLEFLAAFSSSSLEGLVLFLRADL